MNEIISIQGEQAVFEMLGSTTKGQGLGDIGYEPTDLEVKEICQKFIDATESCRKNFYFIYVHKMYEKEPYNCGSVSEFIEKYTNISRATFYRVINEIDMNIVIYGKYDPQATKINSSICQELKSSVYKIGALKTIELWYYLNTFHEGVITAHEVKVQVIACIYKGRITPKQYLTEENIKEIDSHIEKVSKFTSFDIYSKEIQKHDKDYLYFNKEEDLVEEDDVDVEEDDIDVEGDSAEEDDKYIEDEDEDDIFNYLSNERKYESEYNQDFIDKIKGNLRKVSLKNDYYIEKLSVEDLALTHKSIFGSADLDLIQCENASLLMEKQNLKHIVQDAPQNIRKLILKINKMTGYELYLLSEYIESLRLSKIY